MSTIKKGQQFQSMYPDFYRVISPLSAMFYNNAGTKVRKNVYMKIEVKRKEKNGEAVLSISGVEGPKQNGDAYGSCGQIYQPLKEYEEPKLKEGWTRDKYKKLIDIWERWHLNDMRAGCEHQRAEGWEDMRIDPKELPDSHANRDERGILAIWVYPEDYEGISSDGEKHKKGLLTKPCATCGYKYGSDWLHEELPVNVYDFLRNLPATDTKPAWV